MHTRFQMSIQDWIEQCVDEGVTIDGILTDPPYHHLESHRKIGTTTRLQGEWFDVLSLEELEVIMGDLKDLLTRGSHVYFWCNTLGQHDLHDLMKGCGYTFNNSLFWIKPRIGLGYSYRNKCEPILFFSKGKRRQIRDQGQSNVFNYPRPKHPVKGIKMPSFAKPPRIYDDLMRSASREGELWADVFAGTDPFSTLQDKVYTVRFKKEWIVWTPNTVSVDVKFSKSAYPYTEDVLTNLRDYETPAKLS